MATCERCREEFLSLRRTTENFVSWPTEVQHLLEGERYVLITSANDELL